MKRFKKLITAVVLLAFTSTAAYAVVTPGDINRLRGLAMTIGSAVVTTLTATTATITTGTVTTLTNVTAAMTGVLTHTRTPAADSATTNQTDKVALTAPVDTTGTNTHQAYDVALTVGNATGGTNTVNGYTFDNYTGDAQVNVNAIKIGTSDALGTANAINIGSGWDNGITMASPFNTTSTITGSSASDIAINTNKFTVAASSGNTVVAGTLAVTGVATVGGLVTTSPTVVDGVTVNAKALTLPGRASIGICGDGTTINNNTVYYGPSMVTVAGSGRVCDITQAGNTTEATADAPAFDNTAFQVLSMDCLTADPGASGVSFTLRNNAAATVPSVTCSVANTKLGCTANIQTTTAIAAGNPISIAAASAGNQGTTPFSCILQVAY